MPFSIAPGTNHARIRPVKHVKETEIKHVSRPPEARSKVIATATVHAQTCQNMSGYDLTNISSETEIKHVSRPPEARSKVIATAFYACSNRPNHVRIPTCQTNITDNQASNMAAYPLKQESKAIVAATAHAQITNGGDHKCILCTKHAKSCPDTPCQTYQ